MRKIRENEMEGNKEILIFLFMPAGWLDIID